MSSPTTPSSRERSRPGIEHGPPEPAGATPPTSGGPTYEPCVGCGAPLDERQRYCLTCGTRRRNANDPAARFLSTATRRQRNPMVVSRPGAAPRRRGASLATALAVAAIPAALGVGVLIGRSSNNNDASLLAAVKADRSPVVAASTNSGAATGSSSAASSSGSGGGVSHPVSTYSLTRGYAVQLSTLPSSSTAAAAAKVERAARAKGAPSVGAIAQSDFQVTPRPPAGAYVIYSGTYPSQSAAQDALKKLKHSFPAAKIISVRSHSAASAAAPVLSKTHFGSAHRVSSYKPSSSALSQGANVAKQDSHTTGKAASGSGLPDVVAVP